MLVLGSLFALKSSKVQTYLAHRLTSFLAKEWKTKVQIEAVSIEWPGEAVIKNVFIADKQGDTLLSAETASVSLSVFTFLEGHPVIGDLLLKNAYVALVNQKEDKQFNFQFIVDYFATEPKKEKKESAFALTVSHVVLDSVRFVYKDETTHWDMEGVNYFDLDVKNICAEMKHIRLQKDDITGQINRFSYKEKSGFQLVDFKALVRVTPQIVEVADFTLRTPYSKIGNYYSMRYDSFVDFTDYNNKVKMKALLNNVVVSSKDVAFFAPVLRKYPMLITGNGDVTGTVSHLQANDLRVGFDKNIFQAKVDIQGLPDIDRTIFDLNFKELKTSKNGIESVVNNFIENDIDLPPVMDKLGEMSYVGTYKGTWNNFAMKGGIGSALGLVAVDGGMDLRDMDKPSYNAIVQTDGLNLASITEIDQLKNIKINAKFEGSGFTMEDINTKINGTVSNLIYNGYAYKNIDLNGTLQQKLFAGNINIKDDNLKLNFDGKIDLNDAEKPDYNFITDIAKADLYALHLVSSPFSFSTNADIVAKGNDLQTLVGSIICKNTVMTTQYGTYQFQDMALYASPTATGNGLDLYTDAANLSLKGKFDPQYLGATVGKLVAYYIPSLNRFAPVLPFPEQDFTFNLKTKNTDKVLGALMPSLKIDTNTKLSGKINSESNYLQVSGFIPHLRYNDLHADTIIIDGETEGNTLFVNASANTFWANDSFPIKDLAISNQLKNDDLKYNIKLQDKPKENILDLNGLVKLGADTALLSILPSELTLNKEEWRISEAFNLAIGTNSVKIDRFNLQNGTQKLTLQGTVSDQDKDTLHLLVKNFDLALINILTLKSGTSLGGRLDGNANVVSILKGVKGTSDLVATNFTLNADTIGDIFIKSDYYKSSKLVNFIGRVQNNTLENVAVKGKYDIAADILDASLSVQSLPLKKIAPFVKGYISNLSGEANAKVTVYGKPSNPTLQGNLSLNNASLFVDYLQTKLSLDHDFVFAKDEISIKNCIVKDAEGNKATANGSISFSNPLDPVFDVELNTSKFVALNTKAKDNELYYGKAIADGSFTFHGPLSNMAIGIDATTLRGTTFNIPLSFVSGTGQSNYIKFINKKDTLATEKIDKPDGLTLRLNLQVTDEAECRIIFDEVAGDVIRGRGNADLRMYIDTKGDFEMYGQYNITSGDYLFTFQDIIKKKFLVQQGGTIRWDGDPYNARIDLTAINTLRADVTPLRLASNSSAVDTAGKKNKSQILPVQCVLGLKNNLLSPDITFGLDFPDNQNLKSELATYLASPDNVNNQVFSLLSLGSFTNNGVNANFSSAGGEFLSNQLNNWTSKFSDKIGFDLRNLKGVGGSVTLFDDRLTLQGGFNSTQVAGSSVTNDPLAASRTQSQITGDASIEYKINENLRAKAFTRAANQDLIGRSQNTSENVQGLGLFYRGEFDSFGEVWRKIFGGKKKEVVEETLPQ